MFSLQHWIAARVCLKGNPLKASPLLTGVDSEMSCDGGPSELMIVAGCV